MTTPDVSAGIGEWMRGDWEKAVLASDELPPGAKLLALILAVYTGETGQQGVWFSLADFGRLASMPSLGTITRYVEMLEEGGWIRSEIEGRAGTVRFLGRPRPTPGPFAMVPPREVAEEAAASE